MDPNICKSRAIKPIPTDPGAARYVLFNIIDVNGDHQVTFPEFVYFLKLAYSFSYFDVDFDARVHTSAILPMTVARILPIPLSAFETEMLRKFKYLEIVGKIDILQYIAYTLTPLHFRPYLVIQTKQLVKEPYLSTVFDEINLHLIDKDQATCAIGVPKHPNAYYNYYSCLRTTLRTHIMALQLMYDALYAAAANTKKE